MLKKIFFILMLLSTVNSFAGYRGSKRVTVGSHFFVSGTSKKNIYAVLWYYDPAYVVPAEIITEADLYPEFEAKAATSSCTYTTVECVIYYYDESIGRNMKYYDSWNIFIKNSSSSDGESDGSSGDDSPESTIIDPDKITLNHDSISIHIDEEYKLETSVTPDDASGYTLFWRSELQNIAFVDGLGQISGMSPGRTIVEVKTSNNKTDRCVVTVLQDPESITIPEQLVLSKSQIITINPTVLPARCYDKVSWESSDSNVVVVSNGTIVPVKVGNATIIAKTRNNLTAQCDVEVIAPVFSFNVHKVDGTVDKFSFSDLPKATYQGDNIVLSTSNTSKTINKSIIIKYTVFDVNAIEHVSSFSLPDNIKMKLNENYSLTPTILPESIAFTGKIAWSSSNENCVSVNDGVLKALNYGSATITATLDNGMSSKCDVEVLKPQYMTIWYKDDTHESFSLNEKSSVTLSGSKYIIKCSYGTIELPADQLKKITIDDPCEANYPSNISMPSEIAMEPHGQMQLKYTLIPEGSELRNSPQWTASDTTIVDVNNKGLVTAKSTGVTEVTVKLDGGITGVCKVTVNKSKYLLCIWTKNGNVTTIPFEQYPVITFKDGSYIVKSNSKDLQIGSSDLVKYTITESELKTMNGDVNDDSVVNIVDITKVISVIAGKEINVNADVNGDDIINTSDIKAIINVIFGK